MQHDQQTTPTPTRRRIVGGLAVALLLVLLASSANAGAIRLQSAVEVIGPAVTLADVADLEGEHARDLADLEVARFGEDDDQLVVRLRELRRTLSEHDIHWGRIALRGHAAVRIYRQANGNGEKASATGGAASNPDQPVALDTSMSLNDQVIQFIEEMAGVNRSDLRIRFSERDKQKLQRDALQDRFELEPAASRAVGRLPITIRRYEAGQVAETFSVTADVEKRVEALVATRTVSRGETFTGSSVQRREVYLSSDRGQPLDDPGLVVGEKASGILREGAVVYPEHVRSPVLIRRGETVTVRAVSGGLVVRTVARARESGSLDEVIQLRNETTRETYLATVTGRREASLNVSESSSREDHMVQHEGDRP